MIEKEEINEYPYLANYFKKNPGESDDFIKYAEIGEQMGRKSVLHHLIDIYNDYYGKWEFEYAFIEEIKYKNYTSGRENRDWICIPYTMIYYLYLLLAFDEAETRFLENLSFGEAMNHFNSKAGKNFDDMWERTAFFDTIAEIDFPIIAMKLMKKYLHDKDKYAALCFGLWERMGFNDGFLYRCISKSETGLPVDIFIDDSGVWGAKECWNRPIIKFKPYKSDERSNFRLIPMTLDDNPEILFKNPLMELTDEEVGLIKKFVILNKDWILELCYNEENKNFDPRNLSSISIEDNPEIFI
jgi:hypothetical protein